VKRDGKRRSWKKDNRVIKREGVDKEESRGLRRVALKNSKLDASCDVEEDEEVDRFF
jgi:hypothetical protein